MQEGKISTKNSLFPIYEYIFKFDIYTRTKSVICKRVKSWGSYNCTYRVDVWFAVPSPPCQLHYTTTGCNQLIH